MSEDTNGMPAASSYPNGREMEVKFEGIRVEESTDDNVRVSLSIETRTPSARYNKSCSLVGSNTNTSVQFEAREGDCTKG